MEYQFVTVNGKTRKSLIIRGKEYLRKSVNLPLDVAECFEKKCDMFGEDESKVIEKLVTYFTRSNGWTTEEIKQAGSLYARDPKDHIVDAGKRTLKGLFPWLNTN